jgi:putative aldouronate transport system substrate-binding protein
VFNTGVILLLKYKNIGGINMKKSKVISGIMAAALSIGAFSGFTANATAASKTSTKESVKLTMYLLGSAPAGMPAVLSALNKKLKKDINTTIDINYIGWGDLQSKYPLVLASGDDVDMIFTADWAYYQQEAVKGAFRKITQNDFKTYMPKIYKEVDKIAYKQTLVDGKNYMIPTSSPDRKITVALIRGDLRKKYKVPEIKSFDKIEPYLAAIKKHEKNMIPMNLDSQYDIGQPFSDLETAYGFNGVPLVNATGVYYDFTNNSGKVADRFTLNSGSPFKKAAETMKKWYNLGYVNKNPFANKVLSSDSIIQGKSGVSFGNSVNIQSVLAKGEKLGMDLEIIPVLTKSGKSQANSYLNNGMAISANSKHAERAMMALNLIMQDPSYVNLVYFGVEGKNYVIKNGKTDLPAGVTAENNTYPADAAGFWFVNKDLFKPMASWTQTYINHREQVKKVLVNSTLSTFSFDPGKVKTEVANLTAVDNQYLNPIYIGAVKNIDDAIATYKSKRSSAGFETVLAEAKKQTATFVAKNK